MLLNNRPTKLSFIS